MKFSAPTNSEAMLSGPEAVKSRNARDDGYEMESYAIARAAEREHRFWLVVKGISDWGDGTKGRNKSRNQKLAAEKAAQVARAVLEEMPPLDFVDSARA